MDNASDDGTKQLAIRLPLALVERIETHAARLRRSNPGVNVTRTDAVRALINDGLAVAEARDAQLKQ